MVATMFAVAWLGYVATADLFDRAHEWPLTYELSWMGDRPFWNEVVTGLAGAIVIPLVLGVLWGKFRTAGWIAGVGVAVLFHVTIALVAMTALYAVLEWLAGKLTATWLLLLAAAVAAAAAVVFVVSLR
jgi:hypothetical protein